ncbi:MAG: methionine aminotransferase [Deltaproteobacteria bacterium]|nr:methionine aminotransferase [Deltaproteobacteria bacterium]
MKLKINSKLPDVGTTIFTVMSKLAAENEAINLSQGFPEFDASPDLVALVNKYMQKGCNQYPPMHGVAELRQNVSQKTHELYGATINPETEITVTSGATEALYAAITAVVQVGDEVIVVEPAYDSYEPAIRLNGGIPVRVQLRYPQYRVDWDQVRDAITGKTRAIILNSPHNPTGTIFDEEDIAALKQIVADTDIFIISDEVYEHIIFDGHRHESMLRHPELAQRSFVISSFGKTYHVTGWKLGYCVAPAELSTEFRRIHQFLTFTSHTPTQYAIAEYLLNRSAYLDLPAFYQKKRDLFLEAIAGSRFKPLPCGGTFFQMVDYSEISRDNDADFANWLTIEKRVAAIPPSVFYNGRDDHKVLRFCFAKNEDTLLKAGEILQAV